ncbi:acyl dehydratase [Bordetella pertussis]|nr:MaoC-like protein [Bordetella pertussis CHLA-11]ETH02110.1 MaoC-like protein [Bordetella pertussis 2250905]ETH03574.1 MaoC-like protein [Bordetella pertussis 2356847]ETH06242.1 MaoC-like protein [Bordetella pertussis 2371640]ETH11397.1 MaoC-like protein [Bordetella pertussis STO1-SEAT-0006]ETH15951.1 MaoC-like protein [Bordetella pertussis STO1-SEAT-0007]ETH19377.1 MaoC-like protein [Bordetella pertussis CHLA-13]ETH22197.1 MaoC-like protein [Bordetella pertussis CHLA-15]ETH25884.1 MaoC-l
MTQRLEEVSMRVTQADIDIYAELTDDFNPLHVDPAFAATTPMGGTIAHGTLSVNLIWQSLARSLGAAALARIDLDIRFLKPLFAGGAITAGGQPDAAEPDRYEVWVKGADGATLIAGHARLAPITD